MGKAGFEAGGGQCGDAAPGGFPGVAPPPLAYAWHAPPPPSCASGKSGGQLGRSGKEVPEWPPRPGGKAASEASENTTSETPRNSTGRLLWSR
jgi:hypothetical protein